MRLWKGIPTVTAEEMAQIDTMAINKVGLSLFSMMENAGRLLAVRVREMLGKLNGASVVLLVGIGHNGGGGLVAGRFLANWGAQVEIVLGGKPAKLRKVTRQQFRVLKSMGVLEVGMQWTRSPALFIDALLGYRGKGNPREPMADIIREVNVSGVSILALDLPSGLDATTGVPHTLCIKATSTVTLALPKTGLITKQAQPYIGELFLADIGIPSQVYLEVTGQEVPIFRDSPLVDLSAL